MLDVFTADVFKTHELTANINRMPFQPGRIQALKIFSEKSVYKTHVDIEYQDGKLSLVKTADRGTGGGQVVTGPKRKVYTFKIPHLPQTTTITPDDLPDLRTFGTEDGMIAVNQLIADRLQDMRQNLEATMEYHMLGALVGVIKDADGSTIHDLLDIYDISLTTVSVDTSVDNAIKTAANEITRTVQDKLGADTYRNIRVMCGDTLFDNITMSDECKAAFQYQQNSQASAFLANSQVRSSFVYAGITWENYRGSVGSTEFIADDEGRVVPEGVPGLFIVRNGPADTMAAVGKPGQRFVVTREFMKHDTGVELRGQANPLVLCTRPGVLLKVVDETSEAS